MVVRLWTCRLKQIRLTPVSNAPTRAPVISRHAFVSPESQAVLVKEVHVQMTVLGTGVACVSVREMATLYYALPLSPITKYDGHEVKPYAAIP
jgi:hypothetical protein